MRVLDQPDVGHVSVTPEGALALVMTGARADACLLYTSDAADE